MLKRYREKAGLSQNQLSKLSGVPQSVICDIESGKTKAPRIDTLQAIAEVLKMSIDELIGKKAG
jgi:transcriptional regulator with XRE-family HTH domain